jgi:hypothetical protein
MKETKNAFERAYPKCILKNTDIPLGETHDNLNTIVTMGIMDMVKSYLKILGIPVCVSSILSSNTGYTPLINQCVSNYDSNQKCNDKCDTNKYDDYGICIQPIGTVFPFCDNYMIRFKESIKAQINVLCAINSAQKEFIDPGYTAIYHNNLTYNIEGDISCCTGCSSGDKILTDRLEFCKDGRADVDKCALNINQRISSKVIHIPKFTDEHIKTIIKIFREAILKDLNLKLYSNDKETLTGVNIPSIGPEIDEIFNIYEITGKSRVINVKEIANYGRCEAIEQNTESNLPQNDLTIMSQKLYKYVFDKLQLDVDIISIYLRDDVDGFCGKIRCGPDSDGCDEDGKCSCKLGYTGSACEIYDNCTGVECADINKECVDGKCVCKEGRSCTDKVIIEKKEEKKKKSNKWIYILIIVLVLLVAGIVAGFLYFKSRKNPIEEESKLLSMKKEII